MSVSSQDPEKVFELIKDSIRSIAERYDTSNIRYALLTFGDTVNVEVNFTSDMPSVEALREALEKVTRPSGEPNLEAALQEAKMVFKQSTPRAGAKKVLVVIMGQKSASGAREVKEAARPLEDNNIKVVPVAIGPQANLPELETITTNKKFMASVGTDEDPESVGEEIMRKALKSKYQDLAHHERNITIPQKRKTKLFE